MTPKEYLEQLRVLDRRIDMLLERAEQTRARISRVTRVYGSAAGGGGRSDWTDALASLIDEEQTLNAGIDRLADLKAEALRAISTVPEPHLRTALEMRYLNGLTKLQISMRMNCDQRTVGRWIDRGLAAMRMPENPTRI